ncbi:acyl-CoA dehydrogenase family protein [Aquiluna borgnonia]|uniref:acyl-CoA oxidase n=1 Tax=Aquiluna borgnonia TaxID=2499157 RepID=A0A7D4UL14_9MICO|nr:acyl-CoA dehydrogenase [Aquiluna borgnonia]QKJ24658.1 acyl-CoA dehydrogenase family protein [Aquiluna borgnonia]
MDIKEDVQIEVAELGERILGRWAEVRRHTRGLIESEKLFKVEGEPLEKHRERVLKNLKTLVANGATQYGFLPELGGQMNPGGSLASFEELLFADPSLQIKFGVQWGLFGSAILYLGTEYHHKNFLPSAVNLDVPGAFAMTETGHGSDVASIGTTATFDPATNEFVINTPNRHSYKDYLGNAALHGQAAVVFAQLYTQGKNHGVHAFYVPIRKRGKLLPGVGSEDDGLKGGLNGIDNGRLYFNQVRVPRLNLLNRYADVAQDGTYSSVIESPGRRFFTQLGALVQGRVSLTGAVTNAQKLALDIAVRYSEERKQFAGPDGEERTLMDYGRHQRRLLPLIARTYAHIFAHQELLDAFHEVFAGINDTEETRADLETVAAAAKALSTWDALETIQQCREACGGQGFMAEHRLTGLRADLDIYVTFEGDNNVLLQLVAKRLLGDYAKAFKSPDFGTLAQYVAGQVGEAAFNRGGLRGLAQNIIDFGSTARSVGFIKDPEHQHQLLTDRVHTSIAKLANAMKAAGKDQLKQAELFNRHQNELILTAKAHGELIMWEAFTRALPTIEDPETRQVLTWLRDLFGFTLLEKDMAWYLLNGRINSARAEAITEYIDTRLLPRLRPHAIALVDAFLLTPGLVRTNLAKDEAARRAGIKKGQN